MAKAASVNVLKTLIYVIKIYFSNIDKFFIYMLFPVFGQILGINLALFLPLKFSHKIITKSGGSISLALLFLILLALPGLLILIKAFWEYMVAYIALNSMTEGAVTTGKVYDIPSHKQIATRQSFKYICFLIVLSVLMMLGFCPFLWVPAAVLWIYFILVFQVFTFEPVLNIKECFKRSFFLVKGDWLQTFLLVVILAFLSIYIIAMGFSVVFDYLDWSQGFIASFNFVGKSLPLDKINEYLVIFKIPPITVRLISESLYYSLISFIMAGLTLPIRSICFSLWYKSLSDKYEENNKPTPKQTKKRTRKRKTEEA